MPFQSPFERLSSGPCGVLRHLTAIAAVLLLCLCTAQAQEIEDLLKDRRVTLKADGSLLDEVIGSLYRQTGVLIDVEEDVGDAEVTGDVKDLPLGEALRLLLSSAGLTFDVRGDRVVIRKDPDAPERLAPKPEIAPPPPPVSAESLYRRGEYARAEEAIRERLTAAPEDLPLTLLLARVLDVTGRYGEAIETLEEARDRNPTEEDLLLPLGRLYMRTGQYDEAENTLEACGDLLPARAALGVLYVERLGKREEGRRILEEVAGSVSMSDPLPESHLAAGEAYVALGRHEDADGPFARAWRADKDRTEPYLRLAEVYLHKYNQAGAIGLVEDALKIRPSLPEARVLRARCLFMNSPLGTGRFVLATAEAEQALAVNPALPEAHLFLADLRIFDDCPDAARDHIWKALEVNPLSIPARARLAALHLLRDEVEQAKAIEAEVLKDNPHAYRFFLDIADIIETRFRYREAADLARRAIELEPEVGEAYTVLGLNLLRLGEMEKGEEALRVAQERDTNLFVRNALHLLDELEEKYETLLTPHFEIRVHRKEARVLFPYVRDLLEEARTSLGERYGFVPEGRILCEVYADHNSFSARTVGIPWVGAVGVCFGPVLAIDSPTAHEDPHRRAMGPEAEKRAGFSWARTLWHEYTHVVTLLATRNRIPRWLTEGISVLEEGRARPEWSRKGQMATTFFDGLAQGKLLGIGELDRGFTKPEFGGQVILSYFQGAMVCEYIEERYGTEALRGLLDGYGRGLGTEAVFREVLGTDLETFDRGFLDYCREWMGTTGYRPPYAEDQIAGLKAAHDASPEDASAAAKLARAYVDLGRIGEAEVMAARAVELGPDVGDAHAALGMVMVERGRRAQAEASMRRALEHGTTDALRAHVVLAEIAVRKGDEAAAFEHYSAAQKLLPMDTTLARTLAKMRLDSEAEAAAVPYLEAAALQDPFDLGSRLTLMRIYADREDDKMVAAMGRQVVAIAPFEAEPHFLYGEALRGLGRGAEALREYDAALALDHPDEIGIVCAQAEIYLEAGEEGRAREGAERALEIDPDSDRAKRVIEILEAGGPGKEE